MPIKKVTGQIHVETKTAEQPQQPTPLTSFTQPTEPTTETPSTPTPLSTPTLITQPSVGTKITLSFDLLPIDTLLGNSFGKITPGVYMVGGKSGLGKTSVLLHLLAKALKMGLKCRLVDTEFQIDTDRLTQISKANDIPYELLASSIVTIMDWDTLVSTIRADLPHGGYQFYAIDSITSPWNYEFFQLREQIDAGDESAKGKLGLIGQQRSQLAIFFNLQTWKQQMFIFLTAHVKSEFMQKQGGEMGKDELRALGTDYPLLGGGEMFYQSKFWIYLAPKIIKEAGKQRVARMLYLGKHKSKADYKVSLTSVEFQVCDAGIKT